jgi:endonuclease/exonuclease/phosphatase family metal-dependent hydrolase
MIFNLIIAVILALASPAAPPKAEFTVATFNIKGGKDNDSWKQRRNGVVATIVESDANIVLLQEARYPKQEVRPDVVTGAGQGRRAHPDRRHHAADERVPDGHRA